MRELLYLIGEPGSGKTSLFAALTAGLEPEHIAKPFAHTLWPAGGEFIAELGPRREGGFAGTDGLSMSAMPVVLDWLTWGCSYDRVIGEGDRLASMKFFDGAEAAGWRVTVLNIACPPEVLSERRAARAAALGVPEQDATWVKGRETKYANLAERANETLNGTFSTEQLLVQLRAFPMFHDLGKEAQRVSA